MMTQQGTSKMKHLTNEPIGEDWYDGKAQTALADRIVTEIKNPSTFMGPEGREWEHTVVMALEGPWGCGKSNVLKMVENKVGYSIDSGGKSKGEAIFVNYDLWMHRQDLSRKSILESIVTELVDNKKVLPKGFKDKLFHLTGERVHGYVEKVPLFGWMSVILVAVSSIFKTKLFGVPDWLASILLGIGCVTFIGSVLLNWLYNGVGFWSSVGRSLMIASGKSKDFSFVKFRHLDEPSVSDFLDFLREVATRLSDGYKYVILIFDNLDRLNDEEIQKFWAATHVLFAERRTHRPQNVQVIIPYDRTRMRKAFGSSQAGDEYIRKVVDKVFVMPAVIMTDWSRFLLERMKMSFEGFDDRQLSEAVRVFDWLHRPDDLTPRAMISFVNDMVSVCEGLRYDDGEEAKFPIPLSIVALYVLGWRRSLVAEKIDNAELLIVGGAFIPDECKIARMWYLGDLNHSTQLAAVVYQLPEKHAAAILTYQRVGASLDGNMSLGGICRQPDFHQVFSSVIKHVKQFEMVPQALSTIDTPDAQEYWDEYYDVKKDDIIMSHGVFPTITNGEALLFANISKWQEYYMKLEAHLQNNTKGIFNENLHVQFAVSVENALKQGGRTLVNSFVRPPVEPERFVKYLRAAQENFHVLNMQCNLIELDDWFDQRLGNGCEIGVCRYLSRVQLKQMPKTVAKLKKFGSLSDEESFEMITGEKLPFKD